VGKKSLKVVPQDCLKLDIFLELFLFQPMAMIFEMVVRASRSCSVNACVERELSM
jgi:hypothetical protein